MELNKQTMTKVEEYAEKDVVRRALTGVFSKTNMRDMAFKTSAAKENQFIFSTDIKTMSATNQNSSGRCWLFAATNVVREIIAKKINVESFELSQSYLAFWDKFERINYYIESIIETADQPRDSRIVDYIVGTGVHDGGQWDMFANIVIKYGLVPKCCFPETFQSSNTGSVNGFINHYLKAKTPLLRKLAQNNDTASLNSLREEMLEKTYSFLCAAYDTPPKSFDFEYKDKDGKVVFDRNLNPITFRDKYLGSSLNDYVSIINAPTEDKPFDKVYTVKYLGNVVGGNEVCYLNLKMDEFKEIVAKQIKDGDIVWFGSDCGKYGDSAKAAWDPDQFDETALTGLDSDMTKEDNLNYHVSQMNHAMCITGLNEDENGKINRWKIENSWGNSGANAGYHSASDKWFDTYVYQAVVNKKYLGEKAEILCEEKVVLNPWDPMGSLASGNPDR